MNVRRNDFGYPSFLRTLSSFIFPLSTDIPIKFEIDYASDKSVMVVIRVARSTFHNKFNINAFAVHASFFAFGYVLTAMGPQFVSDSVLSNRSTDEVSVDHWNELNDEYAFIYVNTEKGSKKVLVKCPVMNDKFLVDALSEGSSKPVHLEIE